MPDFTAHEHPVLAVACPTCRAKAGAWCRRPSGHVASDLHKTRRIGEVASYASAELVFKQAAIEWPRGRILWRHGARILCDSGSGRRYAP